jgi:hypothetical protein
MRPVPRMSEDDIKEMATDLVMGRLFCATMIPPEQWQHMIPSVFMPLALGGLGDVDLATVGNIVEHLDKAGPRSVNGYPAFFSCRLVHTDDWEIIRQRAVKAQEAMDAALQSEGTT